MSDKTTNSAGQPTPSAAHVAPSDFAAASSGGEASDSRPAFIAGEPAAMPQVTAEVIAVRLNASPPIKEDAQRRTDETDQRLRLARNLDHIEEISAQLNEIHDLIEPQDSLFHFKGQTKQRPPVTDAALAGAASAAPLPSRSTGATETVELSIQLDAAASYVTAASRSGWVRRRLAPIAIAAAVLAIPALVVAGVQPWRVDGTESGAGGPGDGSVSVGWQPELSSPGSNPNPSTPATSSGSSGAMTVSALASDIPDSLPVPVAAKPPVTSPKASPASPLAVSANLVTSSPTVGSQTEFRVNFTDGSGKFGALNYTSTDGGSGGRVSQARGCSGIAPPLNDSRVIAYTFTQSGRQTITFTLSTYTCDGKSETQTVSVTVNVAPAPSASPLSSQPPSSPSAAPSPSPSPGKEHSHHSSS
ncbi:MAG: hypothetical protein DLM55_09845 [Acidimicrobiales bacterium]|nr:MAG: hypothetical protein DLM55_09845 [Acidimicrobiales bacterium]